MFSFRHKKQSQEFFKKIYIIFFINIKNLYSSTFLIINRIYSNKANYFKETRDWFDPQLKKTFACAVRERDYYVVRKPVQSY